MTRESYKYSGYMKQAQVWELADYNGCTLTWKSKEKNVYDGIRAYNLQITVTMSFADFNPAKIQTESIAGMLDPDQFYGISLFTTDEKKLVRWQFFVKETTTDNNSLKAMITGNPSKKTKESIETFDSSSFEITVDGEPMGQRFMKAIQNAVSLCGGKLDKKEPF